MSQDAKVLCQFSTPEGLEWDEMLEVVPSEREEVKHLGVTFQVTDVETNGTDSYLISVVDV